MQTLSKEIEKRIEDIVSVRFYNQITPYDVIRWLFNFDDEDVELAVRVSSSLFLKTSWKHPC